jgi:hypothetical protein
MAKSRAVLTSREREIIAGEADVKDSYQYETISRVRSRIQRLRDDAKFLAANRPDLYEDMEEAVCDIGGAGSLVPHRVEGIPERLLEIIDEELPEEWRSSELSAARIQHLVAEFIRQGTGTEKPDTTIILQEGEFSFDNIQKREKKAMKDVTRTLETGKYAGGPANVGNLRNTAHSNLFSETPASQFREALLRIEERFHAENLSLAEYEASY